MPTATASGALADGKWYFHLCTRDDAGNWSTAAHRGPYIVEASAALVVVVAPSSSSLVSSQAVAGIASKPTEYPSTPDSASVAGIQV
ncbi:MAG: hypothetical protein K8H90_00570, partial [Thermoanaerobaculia bacterium]|nr:hypothetical protein [Thermoanaerobaculia bacterium]